MANTDNQIELIVNGQTYTDFEAARITRSLDCLGGSFEFVVANDTAGNFPLKVQDTAVIKVNGFPVLTGYIERINIRQDTDDHTISITGHDKTVDIVDNSIEQNACYNTPISLKELIENVIRDNMITPFLFESQIKQIATVPDPQAAAIRENQVNFFQETRGFLKITDELPMINNKGDNIGSNGVKIGFEPFATNNIDSAVINIKVIDRSGGETSLLKDNSIVNYDAAFVQDIIAGDPGEKIFDYIDRHAKKKACILNTDGLGNIVIYRNSGEYINVALMHKKGMENSQIKGYDYSVDFTNRFRRLIVRSQRAGSGDVQGIAFDTECKLNRTKIITAEDICDEDQAALMALWEVNKRRADSVNYACEVYGFWAKADTIWQPNQVVNIQDDYAGINHDMLLKEVVYTVSRDNGSTTGLVFVPPDAYALQANDPKTRYNNVNLIRTL